jgi:hypothetical protein
MLYQKHRGTKRQWPSGHNLYHFQGNLIKADWHFQKNEEAL